MSSDHVNRLRVSGEAEAMKAFIRDSHLEDDHLVLDGAVPMPEWIAGTPPAHAVETLVPVEPPKVRVTDDLTVAEYTLVTKKAPWDFAETLSERRGLVVSLATVEPNNSVAEVRVYGNGQCWYCEMTLPDYDKIERACERKGIEIEVGLLDRLASDSMSVVDDYERALPGAAPGM